MLKKGTYTILNTGEFFAAKSVGLERLRIDEEKQVVDRLRSTNGKEFTAINGMCGELAAAKLRNVFPSLGIEPVSSFLGTDAGDTVYGRRIDFKTSLADYCPIRVPTWKHADKDYALITGDYRNSLRYTFRGIILGKDLIREERKAEYKGHIYYTARQDELSDLT